MHANSAKPLSVAILVYDDVKLLDVTGPLQVFSDARHPDGTPAYAISLLSAQGGDISTDTLIPLPTRALDEAPAPDTVLVAGGNGALSARHLPRVQAFLHNTSARRICSVCMGAFILAEAGLLTGKRATTHWNNCTQFAQDYPETRLTPDAIFVRDGPLWTSAGVSAGIDLALALVEQDLGRAEALRLARALVLPLKRQGGQSQFSTTLRHQCMTASGRFDALLNAIHSCPGAQYSVPEMARRSHMSERNFARVFKAELGKPPALYVEQIRVEAARTALLDQNMPIKQVAAEFGFGSEDTLRRAFKRQFGITPSELVEQFGEEKSSPPQHI